MLRRYGRALIVVIVMLAATPAAAQSVVPWPVGAPLRLAFEHSATPPTGYSVAYRFYVNGQPNDQVVFGNPANGVVEFNFPAFTTVGPRTLGVTARWQPIAGSGLVCGSTINCAETTPATLEISVVAVPPPPPAPANLRIILTPTIASNGDVIGVQVSVTRNDGGAEIKGFIPVAHRRTGAFLNSLFLAAPSTVDVK